MHLKFLPGDKEMEPNTPLWRYMKLSTFLLLLKGTAFIPLLSKLQQADPKEVRASKHSAGEEAVRESDAFREAGDWLEKKHTSRRFDLSNLSNDGCFDPAPHRLDEWRFQLSTRRCAWCWFDPTPRAERSSLESMAMWNLYARDGVLIKTTLGRIEGAVQEPGLDQILVTQINYGESVQDLERAKRPFAFKSGSYGYENEVRLVFRVNPVVVTSGVKVRLDPGKLLNEEEVVISPYVEADEANAVEHLARKMLDGMQVRFRQSPERSEGDSDPRNGIEWEDELKRHVGQFSAEEGLPGLLQDL